MKKKLQKIFAMLLVVSMLMSITAFAEGVAGDEGVTPPATATNVNQIKANENTEDGYAYHTLTTGGAISGSVDSVFNTDAEEGKGYVKVSKTIEATETENVFDINLTVETTEDFQNLEIDGDAAVLLVLDTTWSMFYNKQGIAACPVCYELDTSPGSHNNEDGCDDGRHLRAVNPAYTSTAMIKEAVNGGIDPEVIFDQDEERFDIMADSLATFLNNYATGEDCQRMLSVVYFGHKAQVALDWVDVNGGGLDAARTAVSYDEMTADGHVYRWTDPKAALNMADAQLTSGLDQEDGKIKDISNRYVIMLTDGKPTRTMKSGTSGCNDSCTLTCEIDSHSTPNNVSLNASEKAKDFRKNYENIPLNVIGFATSDANLKVSGVQVNQWLQNNIATPNHFFAADDGAALDLGLGKVSAAIQAMANAWKVTDPMGEYIVFESDDTAYNASTNTIEWDLKEETPVVENGAYIYNKEYTVRLDTAKAGFDINKEYLANGYTALSYFFIEDIIDENGKLTNVLNPVQNIDFKVSAVRGAMGEFAFRKVDVGNPDDATDDQPLAGIKFTLNHGSDCSVCGNKASFWSQNATSDANGVVEFTKIPSGHDYIMTEEMTDAQSAVYAANDTEYPVTVYKDANHVNVEVKVGGKGTVLANALVVSTPVEGSESGEMVVTYPDEFDANVFYKVENTPKAKLTIEKVVTGTDGGNDIPARSIQAKEYKFTVKNAAGETVATVELPKQGDNGWIWSETVTGLEDGVYTVEEDTSKFNSATELANTGYTWLDVLYNGEDVEAGFVTLAAGDHETVTATNSYSYTPDNAVVTVKKVWSDDNNRDGLRPDKIIMGLFTVAGEKLSEVTIDCSEDAENSFSGNITYNPRVGIVEVREIGYILDANVEGAEAVYVAEGDADGNVDILGYTADLSHVVKTNSNSKPYITNTHTPGKVDIVIRKTWDATESMIKPVTINLLADGVEIDDAQLSADNNWICKFENLPEYAAGQKIEYTVTEDTFATGSTAKYWNTSISDSTVEDCAPVFVPAVYTAEMIAELLENATEEERANIEALLGTEIPGQTDIYAGYREANRYVLVTNAYSETFVSLTVNKTWNHGSNPVDQQPTSAQFQLKKDGVAEGAVVTVTGEAWTYTWSNLLDNAVWTVEEVNVPTNYTATYGNPVVDNGNITIEVTNTYAPPAAPPPGGGGGNGGGGGGSFIIPEPPVPLAPVPVPEEPEFEEIPEEEVPLAEVPKTGDASALWMMMSALSGAGLAGVSILGRKKRED